MVPHGLSTAAFYKLLKPLGFDRVYPEGTREVVFSKLINGYHCIYLRIYTSVVDGIPRKVGEDTIRLSLIYKRNTDIYGIGKTQRVNRIETWRENLLNRINAWTNMVGPPCPVCSGYMVQRESQHGLFWGCVQYPKCKGSVPCG